MAPWWHISWKGIGQAFLSLFLVTAFICAIALGVAYQLGPWHSARMALSIDPELNAIPSELPDTSIAVLNGSRVEYFGFAFLLPWEHTERVRNSRNEVVLSSGDGAIMFESPSSDPGTARMIRNLAKSIPDLSPEVRGSLCDLQRAAIQAKPDQVKWWKTPSQNQRARDLLLLKELIEPKYRGTLYGMDIGGLCGFQRGDPTIAPYQVWIELFDREDRHYSILINSRGETPFLKQAEINAIVASIRPDSDR